MTDKNIWYLPGPFHRYEDDIKAIAKKAGLRIVDANVTESRDGECEKPPKVTLKELPPVPVIVPPQSEAETELQAVIDGLNAERDGLRGLIESLEGVSPLEHPGAGELPIRLFDALSNIHQGIAGVKAEREGLAAENSDLRANIESLKSEVDALKKAAEQPAKEKAKS